MHLTLPRHPNNEQINSGQPSMTLGWEQGSFALNQLVEGCFDLSIGQTTPLPCKGSIPDSEDAAIPISPVGINLHLNTEGTQVAAPQLLDALLTDLERSLMYWEQRPLGDLYWNRHLIEHLDEGSLTQLAFNLASKLKQSVQSSQSNYQHSVELSIDENSLCKLALLRGLGVTRVVFSLPLIIGPNPQLAANLLAACQRAQDLDYRDICIRMSYDLEEVGAKELLALFLDLPLLGAHELCLCPVYRSGNAFYSLWENKAVLDSSGGLLCRFRKWLTSQGYKALSYDCFVLENKDQSAPTKNRFSGPGYFTPVGQLKACSPDFIGIGPAALSRLGVHITVNQGEFDVYASQLAQGVYPRQSCKKLNSYFLSIERQLVQFLRGLSFDLNQAALLLGGEHVEKVRSQIEQLPAEKWCIDSKEHLILQEDARDWLPLICSWLVHRQPIQEHGHL